jgi:hypothetical protein
LSACNGQYDFQHTIKVKLSLCMTGGYFMGIEVWLLSFSLVSILDVSKTSGSCLSPLIQGKVPLYWVRPKKCSGYFVEARKSIPCPFQE